MIRAMLQLSTKIVGARNEGSKTRDFEHFWVLQSHYEFI